MISPVMARNENLYEQSILEADPTLSRDQFIPSTKLRAKIADFSKESLKVLELYLRQKNPQEDILQLTAECLSVVIPNAGLESALRIFGALEGETLRKLTGKLRSLVPEEILIGLLSQLARQLPSHALCLAAQIILEPHSERALEEAFRCFAELLSQVALDAGAIDLAEEVSERLSSSQINQMHAALGARPSEGGDRLDGLRLKEAYALLREGEVEAANCIVNTLRMSPSLEKEVLRFYDEAGLSIEKVPTLEQKLGARLQEISRDSPSLAETFSILHQLINEANYSCKSKATSHCLISLLISQVTAQDKELEVRREALLQAQLKIEQLGLLLTESKSSEQRATETISRLQSEHMTQLTELIEQQANGTKALNDSLSQLLGEEFQGEFGRSKVKLGGRTEEVKDKGREMKELRQVKEDLETELNQLGCEKEAISRQLLEKKKQLEAELDIEQRAFIEEERGFETKRCELLGQNQDLQRRLEALEGELREELDVQKNEARRLMKELADYREDVKRLRRVVSQYSAKNVELLGDHANKEAEFADEKQAMTQQVNELSDSVKRLKEELQTSQSAESQLKSSLATETNRNQRLTEQLQARESELADTQKLLLMIKEQSSHSQGKLISILEDIKATKDKQEAALIFQLTAQDKELEVRREALLQAQLKIEQLDLLLTESQCSEQRATETISRLQSKYMTQLTELIEQQANGTKAFEVDITDL
jgi:chromosome segregation ATPase